MVRKKDGSFWPLTWCLHLPGLESEVDKPAGLTCRDLNMCTFTTLAEIGNGIQELRSHGVCVDNRASHGEEYPEWTGLVYFVLKDL